MKRKGRSRNVFAEYVSLGLRWPSCEARLHAAHTFMDSLSVALRAVPNAMRISQELGLQYHPKLLETMDERSRLNRNTLHALDGKIICRQDLHT